MACTLCNEWLYIMSYLTEWFPVGAGLWFWPLSWNSSTLATSCEELTHWKRLWCWEGLGAGGEGDDRGWDVWMASLTRWTWVWVNSGSWWWTGRPGVLQFMGSQRVGHDWATELNWRDVFVVIMYMAGNWWIDARDGATHPMMPRTPSDDPPTEDWMYPPVIPSLKSTAQYDGIGRWGIWEALRS